MDATTLSQQLEAKIQEIKATLDEAKSSSFHLNEAQTELIIIDPLLHLLGYGPLQIYKRGHDSVTNNFPDYTLLPNTPHKWFLEVKKLDLHLQDGEAAQAVNYANNQGAEWAVLTNGRTWYIYNAHLPKALTEKRVMQIADLFADADSIGKLLLLSRQSMQSAGLTSAWNHERVTTVVKTQLETPNSVIRKHLRKMVNEEISLSLDDAAIGKAIMACGFANASPLTNPVTFSAQTVSKTKKNVPIAFSPQHHDPASVIPTFYAFDQIAKDITLTAYRKPRSLEFLDGHQQNISSWADAAKAVVEYIGQTYQLPFIPFKPGPKGNNYFLNHAPEHSKGNKMLGHREAHIGTQTIYVDTNRSAGYMVASITSLLKAAGAPPDAVKVSIE